MSEPASTQIESPCVLICQIHQESGHCHGCGRTIDEIMQWTSLTSPMRSAIMDELPARMEKLPRGERRVTRRQRLRQQGT
jgi:predicted Fe-S protein YdhL (DUF1289 family)